MPIAEAQQDLWSALNLELIAFPLDPAPNATQEWWRDLAGSDCQSVRKRHERIDTGDYNGVVLRAVCDLTRIQWGLGAHFKLDDSAQSAPNLGPYQQTVEWFSPLMERWLNDACPPVKRLAFVGKLAQWTPNMETATRLIGQIIPTLPVDAEAIDVQFRINRRRTSTVHPGLIMNRVATWNPLKIEVETEAVDSGRGFKDAFCGCMLTIDMNTDADRVGELPKSALVPLWRELVALGTEIARRGDVK
jgi:hypothetical protein